MSVTKNLAAVLHAPADLRLEHLPLQEPKDGEVLIRMSCVGICGSDYHYFTHGSCGNTVLTKPTVIGHEGSGTVVKLGSNVHNLSIGDRVAIEPGVPCRICDFCKNGRYNLCADTKYSGAPPTDGNLIKYFVHAADFCYKIPDHMSLEEASLVQPLSVGVHACKRAGVELGSVCLITGSGPIGLVTLLTAKAKGARKVLVTDILENRLQLAKEWGADFILKVNVDDNIKDLAKRVVYLLGEEPEISIDCCGNEETIQLCMQVTKTGGNFTLVGLASTKVNVPLTAVLHREVDIKGVCRLGHKDYPTAISMIAASKFNIKQLITHHFDLEQMHEAFQTGIEGTGNPIKIMIHCDNN